MDKHRIKVRYSRKKSIKSLPEFEFHISRKARDKYSFAGTFFSIQGRVIFANFNATHRFAARFNAEKGPDETIAAAELNAMGLLDEIMHFLIESYRKEINKNLFAKIEKFMLDQFSEKKLDELLNGFAQLFPSTSVYQSGQAASDYLKENTGDLSNRHVVLEEMIVLWLDNRNPAYNPIDELINEKDLTKQSIYEDIFPALELFFDNQPPFGPDKLPLLEMLQLPAKKFPNSITAQLEFIKESWGSILGSLLTRILLSMDFIKEEQKARFDVGLFGPGPTYITDFGVETEYEPEQFSADLDWMPRVVIIAKSTYVWLDHLSKQYQRPITRLDQIPDEELDRLAYQGFTGLWLIGLWERSRSSAGIKQIAGNQEAVASAYSLKNYDIAGDLGGEAAYDNLKTRAWKRGIRLASDMVPNHMGIDSDWVINHPEWFIQLDQPPFPTYTFSGPDLCDDERISVYIEDGYWNRTDAAVVFKRLDRYTDNAVYIYHGNDGTSMPWNDTAQLNYLMPEVREAVIQTILHVARKFPIIRFDAAMTLAKKHYQRLWFPEPGHGGDIPSRAEHALTKPRFNELFPVEFWREVVDRIQQEVPDTLLLAEAFWMMEGYFVRSLGMHRVYNSAFMNMLKNEENHKYRLSIKNVLEFNPQILKRYVNFMNNPDEDTAIAQFGKDDKYFGVCMMMAAMPGLPMFGHGQIEGFHEKYGMEYRRAYYDETADEWLVKRHEREIFPVLRKRYLFSDVENFFLYDFITHEGNVNENVFAFSNRAGNESALVLYNNKFEEAAGWVRTSAAYLQDGSLRQNSLVGGLALIAEEDVFICFRDHISGLEFIRPSTEMENSGLYAELGAFKYQVFWGFREVRHSAGRPYGQLNAELNGLGVQSIEYAMDEIIFRPILIPFEEAVNPGSLKYLINGCKNGKTRNDVIKVFKEKLHHLTQAAAKYENLPTPTKSQLQTTINFYSAALMLPAYKSLSYKGNKTILKSADTLIMNFFKSENNWPILLILIFLKALRLVYAKSVDYQTNYRFIRDRSLDHVILRTFTAIGMESYSADNALKLIEILVLKYDGLLINEDVPARAFFEDLFSDSTVQQYLQVNRFEGVVYFNKENFEELLSRLFSLRVLNLFQIELKNNRYPASQVNKDFRLMSKYKKLAESVGYNLEAFLRGL